MSVTRSQASLPASTPHTTVEHNPPRAGSGTPPDPALGDNGDSCPEPQLREQLFTKAAGFHPKLPLVHPRWGPHWWPDPEHRAARGPLSFGPWLDSVGRAKAVPVCADQQGIPGSSLPVPALQGAGPCAHLLVPQRRRGPAAAGCRAPDSATRVRPWLSWRHVLTFGAVPWHLWGCRARCCVRPHTLSRQSCDKAGKGSRAARGWAVGPPATANISSGPTQDVSPRKVPPYGSQLGRPACIPVPHSRQGCTLTFTSCFWSCL